jgi:hypothetical protein
MITTLLAATGLFRSTITVRPPRNHVRRARWRGSDGQWQWAAV